MFKPSGGKLREDEFDGIDKGRFEITKGKRGRMGVSSNFSADVDRRKMTKCVNVDVMVDVHAERGNKGNGVSVKIQDAWEKVEEVSLYVLFLWDPMFFSAVVNNGVLVWVAVDGKSAGRGIEEVGEEVSYRLLK